MFVDGFAILESVPMGCRIRDRSTCTRNAATAFELTSGLHTSCRFVKSIIWYSALATWTSCFAFTAAFWDALLSVGRMTSASYNCGLVDR